MRPIEDRVWDELDQLFERYTVSELATALSLSKSRASRLKSHQCGLPRLDKMDEWARTLGRDLCIFIVAGNRYND